MLFQSDVMKVSYIILIMMSVAVETIHDDGGLIDLNPGLFGVKCCAVVSKKVKSRSVTLSIKVDFTLSLFGVIRSSTKYGRSLLISQGCGQL
jgi:hypothetical protein